MTSSYNSKGKDKMVKYRSKVVVERECPKIERTKVYCSHCGVQILFFICGDYCEACKKHRNRG